MISAGFLVGILSTVFLSLCFGLFVVTKSPKFWIKDNKSTSSSK